MSWKIVLTGGPGAGKTESRPFLKQALEKEGYLVIFVPETATELIVAGMGASDLKDDETYQRFQLLLQQKKEELAKEAAICMGDDKTVVIFDRGMLDGKAYCDPALFDTLLKKMGLDYDEILNSYDAIFHLKTAAYSRNQEYTTENNEARIATMAEAIAQDQCLEKIWNSHACWHCIENASSLEEKMNHLARDVLEFLHTSPGSADLPDSLKSS